MKGGDVYELWSKIASELNIMAPVLQEVIYSAAEEPPSDSEALHSNDFLHIFCFC